MSKYDTQIGNLKNKTFIRSIMPEDRRPEWSKPKLNCEMDTFCVLEIPNSSEEVNVALKIALSDPSPFSLMFELKYGKVDPNFVVGFKGGKYKKFSPKQLKIPDEKYVPGDVYYEGVSDPKAAYDCLYMAYLGAVCKYKQNGAIESSAIEPSEVVDKILDEIKKGARKGNDKPTFVFVDFDMNTIYAISSSDKICVDDKFFGDSCLFENKKFLSKFATVYLERHHGVKPEYFSLFTNEVRGMRFTFPDRYCSTSKMVNKPCRMSICEEFRGYDPVTNTVKCRAIGYYNFMSKPATGNICPNECFHSIMEKKRGGQVSHTTTEVEQ